MYSLTNDGNYKLICSICNGVKYVSSLTNIDYDIYRECDNNHALSSGNMMPVASYDNYGENGEEHDYYKCKYCRYVAPFELNVKQDYEYEYVNNIYHKVKNNIDEDNNGVTDYVIDWFNEKHSDFTFVLSRNPAQHAKKCGVCDGIINEPHVITYADYTDGNNIVTCIECNVTLDKNSGLFMVNNVNNLPRTNNGSYKLPNGIIVLVEEDIQSYLEGTLVFNDANSEII